MLTTVIGHQKDKGWALVDAGWMAMSRDRGTQQQACDFGYGQVCDAQGQPLEGWIMESANQEHGILAHRAGATADVAQLLPVGTLLRIQPNHACATSAQFPEYQMLEAGAVKTSWPRFYGW